MRRTILFALMISLVLLCACSGSAAQDEERLEALRAALADCAGVTFSTRLTADDGEAVSEYELRCARTAGETRMELRAPELLSGVTACLSGKAAVLTFDGLALEAGSVDESGLTPIAAPAALLDALEKGVVSQLRREKWGEGEALAFRVLVSETVDADFWLDAETLAPLRGELLAQGRTAIACEIFDWSIQTKEG